jgi:putative ABC transport system permease protein
MKALSKKLLRDVRHVRGQVLATSLVVACGIASFVTMRSTYNSLRDTQQAYYATFRFADVFASLKRAPESVRAQIEHIPGVAEVQTRVVSEVALNLPGVAEPAQGKLVSVPAQRAPILNDLSIVRGTYISSNRPDEIIISASFAEANGFEPGDRIEANINGRLRKLTIVGIALSPEYIYEIRPGDLFPDNRRYGIIWIDRREVASAFQMDGAFNDVSLKLSADASEKSVIESLDHVLEPYGGLGAYGRSEQESYRFLSNEFSQLRTFGMFLPIVFLGVTAFLLHLVLSRLVATDREQIGLLKAFGFARATVATHYLLFALVMVAGGTVFGIAGGAWLGTEMTSLYSEYFKFPTLEYSVGWSVVIGSVLISFLSACVGALTSVRAVLRLPPAEAMRPESPADYHTGTIERTLVLSRLSTVGRIVFRNLVRQPIKALMATLGIAMASALLFTGFYFSDAVKKVIEIEFQTAIREDAIVAFYSPTVGAARSEILSFPGVTEAEFFRAVPVRLRNEYKSERIALLGTEDGAEIHRIVDKNGVIFSPPRDGLLVSKELASRLGVDRGEKLTIEVLESSRPVKVMKVVDIIDQIMGLNAYTEIGSLNRLMSEDDVISGAYLSIDRSRSEVLYQELKRIPAIASVGLPAVILKSFNDTFARTIWIFTFFLIIFSSAIVFGVSYNAARIALAERGRELASLRVLGFTQNEVSRILFGEQAVLTILAIPVGYLIGYALCYSVNNLVDRDLMRLPLVITGQTLVLTAIVVAAASVVSAFIVSRRLRKLDLIEVLKTRE